VFTYAIVAWTVFAVVAVIGAFALGSDASFAWQSLTTRLSGFSQSISFGRKFRIFGRSRNSSEFTK
jgi:hypothetical protein